MPSTDVSDSFRLSASRFDDGRPEPALPSLFPTGGADESRSAAAVQAGNKREQTRNLRPLPLLGIAGSLGLHLLPLLLLVNWASTPADIPEAIPVALVIETPPPTVPEPAKRPLGRLASEEMGPIVGSKPKPTSPMPNDAPELKTALAAPQPPPEALPEPDASLEPPPPKPQPDPKPVVRRSDPATHLAMRGEWRVLGPMSARDDYLALLVSLTRRHLNLVPPSLIAGRQGDTYLTVLVLGDGTIARIAVARSSGFPDIDEGVERMVAAVGRFPPLPARFEQPSLELILHLHFPEGVER